MATLSIVVFENAVEVLFDRPKAIISVSIDGTSRLAAAIPGDTGQMRHCRIFTDTDCFFTWGDAPTVTDFTDGLPLGADNPEVVGIKAGDQVAVIERV